MGTFRDLCVWQDAVRLAVVVYGMTRRFPPDEKYGLTSQVRRAAVSVSSNIAEGKGRSSGRELCRFLDIAFGSVCELESQIEVAIALQFVQRHETVAIAELIDRTGRGLRNLKRAHERKL